MRINTAFIQSMAAEIRAQLGDDFDEVSFLDTLEGETDALDVADWLLRKRMECAALSQAIVMELSDLSARKMRVDARELALRNQMLPLLDAMGVKKLERPRATISRRAGVASVRITDEASVPTQLTTVKTITAPDKAAIKAQLEAGETVPGAELVKGDDGVTIRVK